MKRIFLYIFFGFIIFLLSACACKQLEDFLFSAHASKQVSWNISQVSINPQVPHETHDNKLIINGEHLKVRLILTPMPSDSSSIGTIDYINCVIENRGSRAVKIIFDESSLASNGGRAYRVVVRGKVPLMNSDESQPPLVIPPQAIINEDFFGVTELVPPQSGTIEFPQSGAVKFTTIPVLAMNKTGQSVKLFLVIEVDQRYEIYITLKAY